MREIRTEVAIAAAPELVWQILTDFQAYPSWNPFIKRISGVAKAGAKLKLTIQPPESKPMQFSPKCLAANPNREFRWLGHLLIPGLFDGEHIFELIPQEDNSTLLIHREKFKGLLIPFFWKQLDNNTRKGFEKMNEALKNRAEAQ